MHLFHKRGTPNKGNCRSNGCVQHHTSTTRRGYNTLAASLHTKGEIAVNVRSYMRSINV